MKKEDLKVGMKIKHNRFDIVESVTAIGESHYLYKTENDSLELEYTDHLNYISEFEPVKEKKKVTLFKYTYTSNNHYIESSWTSMTEENYSKMNSYDFRIVKIESKEIEIDEE